MSKLQAWSLTILALIGLDLASEITARIPFCVINPADYGSYYAQHNECPAFHVFFFKSSASVLEAIGHDWLIAIAAVATAFFTATLWWSTRGMLRATYESIRLARAEFLSTHRPKIRIKHVWLMNEFWYDHPLNVRVVCVNHGTTDAHLIDYSVDFLIVRRDSAFPPDYQFPFRRSIVTVLKPGISGPFPDLIQPITESTEIAVRNAVADFYCIGYLHYADGSKNIRTTAFCRRLVLNQPHRGSGSFIKVENPDYEYED